MTRDDNELLEEEQEKDKDEDAEVDLGDDVLESLDEMADEEDALADDDSMDDEEAY